MFCHLRERRSRLPLRKRKKSACKHQQEKKVGLELLPSHYFAKTGSVPVPDSFKLAAFSEEGGDVSADVLVLHQLCACLSALP